MLSIKEGTYKNKPVSLFQVASDGEPVEQGLVALNTQMQERFRCGDSPRADHTPLIGEIAFIKTGPSDPPAALVALSHELSCLFSVVFVQAGPDNYVASIVNASSPSGCSLGETVPLSAVKEHEGPWSQA